MSVIWVGKTKGALALIDRVDLLRVSAFKWHLNSRGYVRRTWQDEDRRWHYQALHRFILGVSDSSVVVDHINRDKLDNRRSNLRLADSTINAQNRSASGASGRRGVSLHRRTGKWQAGITVDGRYMYLGLYEDLDEAAEVASSARRVHFAGTIERDAL